MRMILNLSITIILCIIMIIWINNILTIQYIDPNIIKRIVLLIFIIILYIIIYIWYDIYNTNNNIIYNENILINYQYIYNIFNWLNNDKSILNILNNKLILGIDNISIYLLLLTCIILPLSVLSNWNNIKSNTIILNSNILNYKNNIIYNNIYFILILILGILLIINYMCIDILIFYIIFELTLIPLFIIISIYGSDNKEKASYYILIYTLGSSLFMLLSIIVTTYILENTSYLIYTQLILSLDIQIILWIGIMIGMVVKIPLYPFHIWLPIVHSESPLGCSIILAGIILKLTIYLILRWILPFLSEANIILYPIIYIICLLTIIIINLIILVQIDLKVIIAYSSICHMAICILGIFSNSIIGINGSLILSICHGFISPGLFIAVGGILYDRYHTRLIYYYNGLLNYLPMFSFYFLILSFANIGTPLSGNFIGEFLSLSGAFKRSPLIISLASISILLSATYQMKLTNKILHGYINIYSLPLINLKIKINNIDNKLYRLISYFRNDPVKYVNTTNYHIVNDLTKRESILMLITILPVLLIGIYPNFLIKNTIHDLIYTIY